MLLHNFRARTAVLFHADLSGRSLGEGQGRGGMLKKESKSEPRRYSATSARKIRAELCEGGCQQCKDRWKGSMSLLFKELRDLLFVFFALETEDDDKDGTKMGMRG
jgi:hypothetical protein